MYFHRLQYYDWEQNINSILERGLHPCYNDECKLPGHKEKKKEYGDQGIVILERG